MPTLMMAHLIIENIFAYFSKMRSLTAKILKDKMITTKFAMKKFLPVFVLKLTV